MRKSILVAALSLLFLNVSCKKDTETSETEVKKYDVKDFFDTKSVSGSGFNTDESKVLVTSNSSGIYNAYEVTVADTVAKPLTSSAKESIFTESYLPNSSSFIYASDQGGDENSHLYVFNQTARKGTDITPWAGSSNSFMGWSRDKKNLYLQSNKRDVKFFDIYKMDTLTWKPNLLYKNETGLEASRISPSERYITLTKTITTDKNELYLYDQQTKKTKKISDKDASWNPMAFEKNDSILYFTTNADREFQYLVRYNMHTEKSEVVFEDKWDVAHMSLSENDKYRIVFINADGKNKVLLFDHKSGREIKMPDFKDGDVTGVTVSPTETKLLLTVGSSTSPTNLYAYDIASKNLKQLTSTLSKKINQSDLVEAEVVRYKSFDGLEIPAIYYKPRQASKNNKVPALVWVHGGPGGQSRVGYSNSIQHLVNQGYAVLAVNNRGSSGYGKTFYKWTTRTTATGI